MKYTLLSILVLLTLFTLFGVAEEDSGAKFSLKKPMIVGAIEHMDINNIDLPLKNDGSTGEDGEGYYPNGQTTLSFLFSGGFATTAYINGQLRASWMAPASLIEEWQPGKWGMDPTDAQAKFYVVNKSDGPGSPAFVDWADAVALGADYHDLDGNGAYDPNIDAPDLLGDRTIWTVINDGTPLSQRTPRLGTDPIGLEVHQSCWAFSRADELGDVIFFRYRLINATDEAKDDLIFTVWTDPDLGDFADDLIGCDTIFSLDPGDTVKSMGYIFNDADDPSYGANPPAFGIDFFQGPIVESPGDTAYLYRGPFFGIDTIPDMVNLPMTSFMYYIQSDAVLGDPNEAQIARNYQEGGLDRNGDPVDPTAWGVGGTTNTDPRFFYSGDPGNPGAGRTAQGWLDSTPADKRFMLNTGPFQLAVGDTQDIVVAYMVSQDNSALSSLDKLRRTDIIAQKAFDANFDIAGPPPPPRVTSRTFDNRIELIIDLEANGTLHYDQPDLLLNRQVFEAIKVYQFQSENTGDFVGTTLNARNIANFDLDNEYGAIFVPFRDGTIQKVWNGYQNLDTLGFVDTLSGIIRLVIDRDAFNNDLPLINNRDYFFGVTAFSLNYPFAQPRSNPTDILVSGSADWLESSRQAAFVSVTPGTATFSPYAGDSAVYTGTRASYDGQVYTDVVDRILITGHDYIVNFYDDGNFWSLTDAATSEMKLDSMVTQASSSDAWNFPVVDGVSFRVSNVEDILDTAVTDSGVVWLEGNASAGYEGSAVFGNGINLTKYEKPALTTVTRAGYFPIRLEVDTTNISNGYFFLGPNFNLFREVRELYIRAFDISDPENERQVNICYRAGPSGDLLFNGTNEIMIMTSDYDAQNAYSTAPDSVFRSEALVIMNLTTVSSDSFKAGKFNLFVHPKYPNSDLDQFTISTASFLGDITMEQRQSELDNVKVVPNPYWGYSIYETSYDTPVLKFTHLDDVATIRIFNLAGQLVKTIQKNSEISEISWDLRNEAGLKIASGMYIAHIEVPDVGEKILKFAVVQREERIDRY